MWCVVFRVYSVVFGVWCVVYGVYSVVWCVWCEVYGERGQTSDIVSILNCVKMADLENDKEKYFAPNSGKICFFDRLFGIKTFGMILHLSLNFNISIRTNENQEIGI